MKPTMSGIASEKKQDQWLGDVGWAQGVANQHQGEPGAKGEIGVEQEGQSLADQPRGTPILIFIRA